MGDERNTDKLLNGIIVYGLTLSFVALVASSETLRFRQGGFGFEISWRTALACIVAAIIFVPCFHTLIHSRDKVRRRLAYVVVIAAGVGSFFYPMRFVPHEKMSDVLTGLGFAVVALGMVAALLLLVRKFIEGDSRSKN